MLQQWTWTWANSGRWWGTGRPDVLQSTGLQRVGHDWATEQQQHTLFKNNLFTPNFTTSYVLICFLIGRKLLYNVVGFCHTTMCCCCCCSKSLQLCLTLCDTIDGSPPGSPVPGILQARTLEWVAISFSNAWTWKVKVKSLSRVRLFLTPWTTAYQAPPSMGFSRQEYWSGLPLPPP